MMKNFINKIHDKPSPIIMWRVFAGFLALSALHPPAFIPMMSGFVLYHAIGWATDDLDEDIPEWVEPVIVLMLTFGAVALVLSGLISIMMETVK